MKLNVNDLDHLALGATFLATGGGGDPYVPKLLTAQALREYGPVVVLSIDDLADDANVVALGGVGAPTVGMELLPSMSESLNTLLAYEQHTGSKVDAVVSFEIGGGNSLVPIMAAAGRGIPIVDGDGMGRALPEAQMMTYAIAGASPTPAVAYDYQGNVTTFSTPDTPTYERHIRSTALASGGMITTAEHPMTGKFLKSAIIPDTISFSIRLGRVLGENRGDIHHTLATLQDVFADSIYGKCELLYCGKVTDKTTSVVGGFDIGEAKIESFDNQSPAMTVHIKNEYLVAKMGERVLASVPDLIVLVEYETSLPINAERLCYGQRVAVLAIGCPDFFKTEAALNAVAPRCFGFDFDYQPLT